MNKTLVNFWLDCFLLVNFLALAAVAVILQYVFPVGIEAFEWTLFGKDYVWWQNVQFGTLSMLGLGVVVHVMLHWAWVCGVLSTKILRKKERMDEGTQTLVGVGAMIVMLHIVGFGVALAYFMIRKIPTG